MTRMRHNPTTSAGWPDKHVQPPNQSKPTLGTLLLRWLQGMLSNNKIRSTGPPTGSTDTNRNHVPPAATTDSRKSKPSGSEPKHHIAQHRRKDIKKFLRRLLPQLWWAPFVPLVFLSNFLHLVGYAGIVIMLLVQAAHTKPGRRFLRPRHEVPETIPKRWPQSWLWRYIGCWLYQRLGWQWLTKLSWRERYHNARKALLPYRNHKKTIAITNSKGGSGKSLLASWLSATYAWFYRFPPIAFDVNESPGSTASRLGVKRDDTITLRDFLAQYGDIRSLSDLVQRAERHRDTGAIVISSNARSIVQIVRPTFEAAFARLKEIALAIFCDCGNEILNTANLGSVREADVLVVPVNIHMADADSDARDTRDAYSDVDDGAHADKVERSIIVIIGSLQFTRKKYANYFGVPPEQVFIIPWKRYMKKGKVVNLKKVSFRIRVILLEILLAIMQSPSASEAISTTSDMPPATPRTMTSLSGSQAHASRLGRIVS